MLRIVSHIERLLLVHDCVIVPKFGGFVLQTVPGVQDKDEHIFHPLRKEIRFNVTLQHDDGLLPESYMQAYAADYRRARLMLEEDVEEMKESLRRYHKLSMGELGVFSMGEEGQMIFHPGETDLFCLASYGLPVFHFPALAPVSAKREEVALLTVSRKKKDTLYIPVSRRLIRTFVASAAAIALFLIVSTPVEDVNQDAYTASFVPSEIVSQKAVFTEKLMAKEAAVETESSQDTTENVIMREAHAAAISRRKLSVSTAKPVVPEAVKAVEKKEEKLYPKMYHIVIASFPSEVQANEFMSGVDRKECAHVSKVVRDGKYRIYADKFDNREAAESYMATLRKNPKYKDAWLYISR